VKTVCPVCGKEGYLSVERRGRHKYTYIIHIEGGRRYKHYAGRDGYSLAEEIAKILGADAQHVVKIIHYAGGDYRIADILLPRIHSLCKYKHCTFVEVFGGSGYMTQNVDRSIFTNVVYNDINDRLTTLYRVIRDSPEKMAALLAVLPYGRQIYRIMKEIVNNKDLMALELAAAVFYTINASFLGKYGFAYATHPERGVARPYFRKVAGLISIASRWHDVTIENLDFREVIRRYDREATVFYLDPPYPDRAEEYYGTPFSVDDLRDMARMLTQIKGRFLLKLDDRTYRHISDILSADKYMVETFTKKLHMEKVESGKSRGYWILVLVSNPK
jgi:DNA adenine methylase